jgi:hypothetical protein
VLTKSASSLADTQLGQLRRRSSAASPDLSVSFAGRPNSSSFGSSETPLSAWTQATVVCLDAVHSASRKCLRSGGSRSVLAGIRCRYDHTSPLSPAVPFVVFCRSLEVKKVGGYILILVFTASLQEYSGPSKLSLCQASLDVCCWKSRAHSCEERDIEPCILKDIG